MRIAFLQRDLPSDKHGGVADQVHLLANTLCRMGESVTVFTLSERPSDALYDVKQIMLPKRIASNRLFKRYLLGYYFSKVDLSGFEVIHAHGDNYLLYGRRPQVRTYYGSAIMEALNARRQGRFFSQAGSYVLELCGIPCADIRTAISPGTRGYLPAIDEIVPCGVDLNVFSPGKDKSPAPSILFVGTLKGRKRGDMMLDIFRCVRRKIPEAELLMVTPEHIEGMGIKSHNAINMETLVELYRKAWVYCMPSSYEGFGVPLVEAMACGTPVVSNPSDGPCFVLDDGRYGILVQKERMADEIISLFESSERRKSLSEKGLVRARDFDILKTAKTYLRLYHDAIQLRHS